MGDETDDDKKARIRQRVRQRRVTKQLDRDRLSQSSVSHASAVHQASSATSDGQHSRGVSPDATDRAPNGRGSIPFVDDGVGLRPGGRSSRPSSPEQRAPEPYRAHAGSYANGNSSYYGDGGIAAEHLLDGGHGHGRPQHGSQHLLLNEIFESMKQMSAVASTAAEAAKDAASAAASAVSAADRAAQAAVTASEGGGVRGGGSSGGDAALQAENERLQKQLAQAKGEIEQLSELKEKNEMLDNEMDRFSREFSQLASRKQELEIRNQQLSTQLEKTTVDSDTVIGVKTELASVQANTAQLSREKAAAEAQRDMFASEVEALKVEMAETERDLEVTRRCRRHTPPAPPTPRCPPCPSSSADWTAARPGQETIEKEALLDKANQKMKAQIAQASQLIHENEALKDDQALLTQELKRMQVGRNGGRNYCSRSFDPAVLQVGVSAGLGRSD